MDWWPFGLIQAIRLDERSVSSVSGIHLIRSTMSCRPRPTKGVHPTFRDYIHVYSSTQIHLLAQHDIVITPISVLSPSIPSFGSSSGLQPSSRRGWTRSTFFIPPCSLWARTIPTSTRAGREEWLSTDTAGKICLDGAWAKRANL